MGSHSTQHFNLDERYDFTAESKKRVITWLFVGIVMFVVGLVWLMMDSGSAHDAHGAAHAANAHGADAHGGGHAPGWQARLYAVPFSSPASL
jgi:hypothetical protein